MKTPINNSSPNRRALGHGIVSKFSAILAVMALVYPLQAQNYGIKFLGNQTTDLVTTNAGVVPIPGWNNINNGSFTSGAVTSSDGSQSATLTLSGTEKGNAWSSGISGDGANNSLMHGYMDCGINGNATATITGLPDGQLFNVYIYSYGDQSRPQNTSGGDWLPNFSVNGGATNYFPERGYGSSIYTAERSYGGNGFTGTFILATSTNRQSFRPIVPATYGNYLVISNVVPVGGVITVGPAADQTTSRSPLNGIEVVPNDSSASFGIHFLGNHPTDLVTGTAGFVPIGFWANITNAAGATGLVGSDGSSTATLTLAGGQSGNSWSSGLAGDGANYSLYDGIWDAGNYGGASATAAISGLTASSYTVYLYALSDSAKPGGAGNGLPNYSVNATTNYFPVLGNTAGSWVTTGEVGGYRFDGYQPCAVSLSNNNLPQSPASFGNYIVVSNVVPSGGSITLAANSDQKSFRSAWNGFELIPNDASASFGVHFLGGGSDSVTTTAGIVPIGNWNNLANSATTASLTGSDGLTAASMTLAHGTSLDSGGQNGTGNGGDSSLMDGYIDAGNNGSGNTPTAVVSGLTASSYTVYMFCEFGNGRPASAGDWLPSYSVNGTNFYAPAIGALNGGYSQYLTTCAVGGQFNLYGFQQATTTNANSNSQIASPALFGNFIKFIQIPAVGGQISVAAEPDSAHTYRTPFEGFELVAVPPTLKVQPSGSNIVLSWSAGILLQAPNVTGPWTTNSSGPPFSVTINQGAPQMFYRVLIP
ncbi:MAG TPA: hypothetical protein VGO57_18105 [Verrucomicrobiae bacterium]|jgi:hypothetical protein